MTTLPTIHLNGSGAENLYQEYRAAWNELRAAREALVHATCNARDFYPQGDDAFRKAREERSEVFLHLQKVEEYLSEWVMHTANYIKPSKL